MFRNPQSHFTLLAVVALSLTLLATLGACRDSHVATYQAPKEPAAQIPSPANPAIASDAAPTSQIRWHAPAHWHPSPPANSAAASVRVGSFAITATDGSGQKADMAVTTFPGDVGGDLANINRWRGQLQLAPIGAAELPGAFVTIDTQAGQFFLSDMSGSAEPRQRTLGAWFRQPAQNRTWFFKLTGDAALVANEREAFIAFLKTVTFTL